jgi:diphthamide synthase (EF-2-diphthine--ammonia ligase)
MSREALTSGGKDSILSIRKVIDRGRDVEYIVTARPITFSTSMVWSTPDRHEMVLGGFT